MSAKNIGTIKTVSQKSIGRLYRPTSSKEDSSCPSSSKNSLRQSRKINEDSSNRKRANSVGKIYTTSSLQRKELVGIDSHPRGFRDLINYQQMQEKLSNYLTCTIRTSNRQKYNYLSQHYANCGNRPDSQQYGKLKYCQNDIRPRASILQLAENNDNQLIDQKTPFYYQYPKRQDMAKVQKIVQQQESLQRKQNKQQLLSNKENIHWLDKTNHFQKINPQKQSKPSTLIVHTQHKNQLSNKLMKIIDSYENKNKQLSFQMKRLQKKFDLCKATKNEQEDPNKQNQEEMVCEDNHSEELLTDIYTQLNQYNRKTTSLSSDCDPKLEELWKSIHSQMILDDKLRIVKSFINEDNITQILQAINSKRIKKIEISSLKTHSEEYDPFLFEQLQGFLKGKNLKLTNKTTILWIAHSFVKYYQDSERHWLKYLSQEKMECAIRSMILEREITGLRQNEGAIKELNLRDFTRWLSTLFKGNLRNRNVYQIYNKLKDMGYVARFIELLEEKAGKGSDLRKLPSSK